MELSIIRIRQIINNDYGISYETSYSKDVIWFI
jgi:hypothetical protein